jgi:hypothetical protein
MKEKRGRRITIRVGPLGLSLLAAGITAIGFAAVSLADSGGNNAGTGTGVQTFQAPAPPGGAAGRIAIGGPNLSAADRQKMEEFQQCMEENGAPAPPDPSNIDPSNPPKPPSADDQQKLQKAFEACKDKLPDALQNAGPPRIGTFKCGPPPGQPGKEQGQSQNQDQNNDSGTSSSGSSS